MKKIKQIMLIVFLLGFSTQVIAADDLGVDNSIVSDAVPKANVSIPEPIEVTIIKEKISEKDKVDIVQQKWWENVIYNTVFNVIFPIFVPVLSALIFWLIRKIGLKIELQTLDDIAAKAALYAEKRSAEWLKEHGEKSEGATKAQWAWQLVETIDTKLTASDKARAKLRKIILTKVAAAEEQVALAEAAKLSLEDQKKINKEIESLNEM